MDEDGGKSPLMSPPCCESTVDTWRMRSWLIWLTLTVRTSLPPLAAAAAATFGSEGTKVGPMPTTPPPLATPLMEPDDIDLVGELAPGPPTLLTETLGPYDEMTLLRDPCPGASEAPEMQVTERATAPWAPPPPPPP